MKAAIDSGWTILNRDPGISEDGLLFPDLG